MRRMSACVIAMLAMAWLAAPASAQTTDGVAWGATVGVGIGYGAVPEGTTREMEPTVNVGLFSVFRLTENWSFQPEVKYDRRTITTSGVSTEVDYVSVPLLLRNRFLGIYMVQGVSVNVLTRATVFDFDFKEAHTSPDVAIILGAGKRFDRFSLEGRWETGLRSFQKDLDIGGVRLRTLTAVASVYF